MKLKSLLNMATTGKFHGEAPTPTHKQSPKSPIPRSLRNLGIVDLSMSWDQSAKTYGLWKIRLVHDMFWRGTNYPAGDSLLVPGNYGLIAAQNGDAYFIDERLNQEQEAIDQIKKLGLDRPEQLAEVEAFKPRSKQAFATDVAV